MYGRLALPRLTDRQFRTARHTRHFFAISFGLLAVPRPMPYDSNNPPRLRLALLRSQFPRLPVEGTTVFTPLDKAPLTRTISIT
jgi:hypothetical protein